MIKLLKATTLISSLLLMLATVLTAGFAIIDWIEADRWVGASFWWRNLLLGAVGIVVAVATFRVGLRSTCVGTTRECLIAIAANLLAGVVLGSSFMSTPKFPMLGH